MFEKEKSGAVISSCGKFQYLLHRRWDVSLNTLGFVMRNPSIADGDKDDPTIRKCMGFAKRLGYGGIQVVNLYAYRSTKSADLKAAGWLIGPENDDWIELVSAQTRGKMVCAWGSYTKGLARPVQVLKILKACGVKPHALRINVGGIPSHPLLLPYTCVPTRFF